MSDTPSTGAGRMLLTTLQHPEWEAEEGEAHGYTPETPAEVAKRYILAIEAEARADAERENERLRAALELIALPDDPNSDAPIVVRRQSIARAALQEPTDG